MNVPLATQAEAGTLTKPRMSAADEWAVHMVTAALKCAGDERTALAYITADEAKYSILKTLNWFEAHNEYEWPDFAGLNYSFDQVMRLRRALVADVYIALQKAGNIKLGVHVTPESNAGTRRRRSSEIRRTKRFCKQEPEADPDAMSDPSEGHAQSFEFSIDVVMHLIQRSNVDMEKYMKEGKDVSFVADLVHDELVEMWDGPLQEEGEHLNALKERAEVWGRHKRGVPPVSSQRERTATPRVALAAPHTLPLGIH